VTRKVTSKIEPTEFMLHSMTMMHLLQVVLQGEKEK